MIHYISCDGNNALHLFLLVASNSQAKDGNNAVHGFVLPPHRAGAVSWVIPVTRTCRVQTSPVLLHYHASYDIFEGLLQFGEGSQAWLDHRVGPLPDLGVRVAVPTDRRLNWLFDDVAHLVHYKLSLLGSVIRHRGLIVVGGLSLECWSRSQCRGWGEGWPTVVKSQTSAC